MSMWNNVKKHGKSFALKGFVYGAIAGALIVGATCLMGASVLYALSEIGASGVLEAMGGAAGVTAEGAAGASGGIMLGGAKILSASFLAPMMGFGAAVGSFLGAAGGAAAGSAYGAVTDEGNPLPKVVEVAANKIVNKSPQLAKVVATKVEMQEAASAQLAAQGGVQVPKDAPMITPRVTIPEVKKPSASFQDRVTAQASTQEMATTQR